MCMTPIKFKNTQTGFALLITLLVLSVVVAVTLAIVELSLKQLKLAVDSTDSEIAFHAASAGLECARYTRRHEAAEFETGATVSVNCFTDTATNVTRRSTLGFTTTNVPTNGQVYRYQRSIEWGDEIKRCTSLDIVVMVATSTIRIGGSGSNSLTGIIPGYESDYKDCTAGERCTIISAVGYSSACNATSSSGVLKREILLEL